MAEPCRSLKSSNSNSDWDLSANGKNRFSPVAPPEELFHEIEVLHDELDRSNEQLRSATSELEKLRKQVQEQEDGSPRHARTQRPLGFDIEGATEAEVRWGVFVTERARLQSEKGWRRALKESKKILADWLENSRAETKARDRELVNLRNRLGNDAHEVQKEKAVSMDLREKLNEAKATLESERQLLVQEREKNCQLEEEFAFLHHTKESDKLAYGASNHNERSERRLVTNDLASQLHFDNDDFKEYDEQHRSSLASSSLEFIQEEEEDESHPHSKPSRTFSKQLVRPSIQQQQPNARPSVRQSIFLQREDDLRRRLSASEAARKELEAQVADLQGKPQPAEHATPTPPTPSRQVTDPELSGANNELWEECEELRVELAKISQAKEDAKWEARDNQRRLQASEAQCQELQAQVSDMQHRAQLAEKQFRDWQKQTNEPWWSKLACHCLHKRPNEGGEQSSAIAPQAAEAATSAGEDKLQLSRKPRVAVHVKGAKNTGASWLSKPMG